MKVDSPALSWFEEYRCSMSSLRGFLLSIRRRKSTVEPKDDNRGVSNANVKESSMLPEQSSIIELKVSSEGTAAVDLSFSLLLYSRVKHHDVEETNFNLRISCFSYG